MVMVNGPFFILTSSTDISLSSHAVATVFLISPSSDKACSDMYSGSYARTNTHTLLQCIVTHSLGFVGILPSVSVQYRWCPLQWTTSCIGASLPPAVIVL